MKIPEKAPKPETLSAVPSADVLWATRIAIFTPLLVLASLLVGATVKLFWLGWVFASVCR